MKKIALLFVLFAITGKAVAQQKVGDNPTSINSNAALEIESTNKGLLIPRIALTSTNSASPLSAFVAGMMVYNTATIGDVVPGFYVSTGSSWSKIDSQTSSNLYNSNGTIPASTSRVVTFGSAANLNFDANTLYIDGDNNRVGIGTNSPGLALHVKSTTPDVLKIENYGATTTTAGASNISLINTNSTVGNYTSITSRTSTGGYASSIEFINASHSAATGDIRFVLNNAGTYGERLRITGAGNVGIGNATPTEKLDVTGNIRFSGALMPNNTAGTSGQVLTSAGAGAVPTWTTLTSNTGSTSVILNGTSFERAALTGDVTATQNSNALTVTKIQGSAVSATAPTSGQVLSWNGTAWTPTTSSSTNIYNTDGTLSGNRAVSLGTNKLSFSSSASTGTSHFVVDGTTFNLDAVNHRIGVGTNAPSAILHVSNNSNILSHLVENTLATNYAMTGFKGSAREYRVGTGGASETTYGVSNSFFVFDVTANAMRLVVNSSGSIGIGTASPATEFDMPTGSMKVGTTASYQVRTGAGYIDFYDNAGTKTSNIAQNNTNGDLYLNNLAAGKNTLFNISNSGKVGIGNATPTEKLDVTGNVRFSGALMPNNTAGTAGQVLTSAGAGAVPTWTTPASATTFYAADGTLAGDRTVSQTTKALNFTSTATTGTSHFTVDGITFNVDAFNNRIGIGTATPSYTLDVNGNARLNNTTFSTFLSGTTIALPTSGPSGLNVGNANLAYAAAAAQWFTNAATGDFAIRNTSNILLGNSTSGASTMAISGNKVGIGNNSPSEMLDVTGNVKFSGALMPNNTAGTAGQVLTSAGAGAVPTWTTVSGLTTLYNGDGSLSGNRTVTQGTNNLAFTSSAVSGTSHFTVDGTTFNVNAVNNRIGLGLAAPVDLLHLEASGGKRMVISNSGGITNNEDIGGITWRQNDGTGTVIGNIIMQGNSSSTGDGTSRMVIGTRTNDNNTSLVESMTIHSNGNIGLGNSSPSERLQVTGGNILITDGSNQGGWLKGFDDHHSIYMREGGSNVVNYYEYGGTLASGSGHIFKTGGLKTAQTTKLQIADDGVYVAGNLGVGTTSPGAKLDVRGYGVFSNGTNGIAIGQSGWSDIHAFGSSNRLTFNYGVDVATDINFNSNANVSIVTGGTGSCGIGTYTPSYKLEVIGTSAATSFVTTSDARYKKDVKTLEENTLDNLLKMRPVSYVWNDLGIEKGGKANELQIGFIAQELEKIYPTIVSTDKNGFKAVNYIELVPVLTKSIQEQQVQISEQQTKIDAQQNTIDLLLRKLDELNSRLNKLEK